MFHSVRLQNFLSGELNPPRSRLSQFWRPGNLRGAGRNVGLRREQQEGQEEAVKTVPQGDIPAASDKQVELLAKVVPLSRRLLIEKSKERTEAAHVVLDRRARGYDSESGPEPASRACPRGGRIPGTLDFVQENRTPIDSARAICVNVQSAVTTRSKCPSPALRRKPYLTLASAPVSLPVCKPSTGSSQHFAVPCLLCRPR